LAAALDSAGIQGGATTAEAVATPRRFVLSQRFKDAFKLALAMVLAYGTSLALGWGHQYWSGLAVAMCGLTAAGDSLNKGLLRICGTLAAVVCTLTYVSLFPQDRWLFLLCLTLHAAFCTYMLGSTTRWYFWCVLGFTPAILAVGGGTEALATFQVVVLRAQETTLGVLIYSLVSAFVWPQDSHGPFLQSVRKLIDLQRHLTADTLARTIGRAGDAGSIEAVQRESEHLVGGLKSSLDAAELDGLDIWDRRQSWRRLIARAPLLSATLAQWQQALQEVQTLEMGRILPGLTAAGQEFDRRFIAIDQMLTGAESDGTTSPVDLSVDANAVGELDQFNRAVVVSLREHLESVDDLTAALLDDARDIRRAGSGAVQKAAARAPSRPWSLDPDRLTYALRNFCAAWIGLVLWIWVPGLPKGLTLAIVLNSATISMALMPTVSPRILLMPGMLGVLFAGSLYLLVMPKLGGFPELAGMLFAATFLLAYLLPLPKNFVSRPISLSMLVMVTAVANEQTYSFVSVAQWFVLFPIIVGVLIISSHFPISMRTEDIFLRQIRRFLRSCAFITAARNRRPLQAQWIVPVNRWRSAFHHNEVSRLPAKLTGMGGSLADEQLGMGGKQALDAMLTQLAVLAHRVEDLSAACAALHTTRPPRGVLEELEDWLDTLTKLFADLASDPGTVDYAGLRQALSRKMERIEASVASAMTPATNEASWRSPSQDAQVALYRLLGALRGSSTASLLIAEQAAQIDWRRLRESRF